MTEDFEAFSQHAGDASAGAEIVPPSILQLKRLTRDLHQRVAEFGVLMQAAAQQASPPEREEFQRLLANVELMRQQMQRAGELAQASVAAMARQNPAELIAIRDQLLGYMAQFPTLPKPLRPSPDDTLSGDAGHT